MLGFANAKINLGLHITEKRRDGYHNLETLFYPIAIKDVVEISDAPSLSIELHGLAIPPSGDNLCVQAFKMIQRDFDIPHQKITLLKQIPIGAGLGGGSADAAEVIKLVNRKFNLKLNTKEMQHYAKQLGADCAFFIENKACIAYERGDVFEDFAVDLSPYYLVLVKAPVHVSTQEAYASIKPQKPLHSLKEILHLPITTWKAGLKNDFEDSVFERYPQIQQIKDSLYHAGAVFALMSGSGSSVFALFNRPQQLPELEKENLVFYNV